MNNVSRQWIISFFLVLIISLLFLEIFYRTVPVATVPIERNVAHKKINAIEGVHKKHYDNIIFGTSITLGALGRNIFKYEDTLNIALVGDVTFAGYYFILKRYLAQNNTTRNVYIFYVQAILHLNFDTSISRRQEYLHNIFTNKDEVNEISLFVDNYKIPKKDYFEERSIYLKRLRQHFFSSIAINKDKIKLSEFKNKSFDNLSTIKLVSDHTVNKRENRDIKISKETSYFLKMLSQLTNENNIQLHLVLEPMQSSVYNSLLKKNIISQLKTILNKNTKFINTNEYYDFPNHAFQDRLHLKSDWAKLYEKIIFSEIVSAEK